jgi:hypothetical protein
MFASHLPLFNGQCLDAALDHRRMIGKFIDAENIRPIF